jgi:hypothetical protein
MSASRYPFQMAGRVPVVLAPAEIDLTTVGLRLVIPAGGVVLRIFTVPPGER